MGGDKNRAGRSSIGHRLHARLRLEAFTQLAQEQLTLGHGVSCRGELEMGHRDIARIETVIDSRGSLEAFGKEPCSDQSDQSERDFRHYQHPAEPEQPGPCAFTPATLLQHAVEISARAL